ncbi:hypothetical protein AB0C08_38010, partial [Microbispora bryophytorum]|uniref:hypothetical protein n=1 Tax=Microbispora bryophytorum TaxID=1460882 RepID=UPI0033C396D5
MVGVFAPGRCGVVALGRRKVKVGAPGSGVRGCPGLGIGCCLGIGCRSGGCLGFGSAGGMWPVGAFLLSRCGSVGYARVAHVAGVGVGGDGVFDVAVFHTAGPANASGVAADAGVLAVPAALGTGRALDSLSVPAVPGALHALGALAVLAALGAVRTLGVLGVLGTLPVLGVLAVPAVLGTVRALGVLGVLVTLGVLGVLSTLGVFGFGVVGLGVGGQGFGVDQNQKLSHDLLLHQRDERIHLAHPQRPIIALRTRLGIRIQQRPQPRRRLTR